MHIRYKHLLSPIQIGNVMLKNRMTATAATPHFLQGTEPFPTEKWITHLVNRAKNGAAAININHLEHGSPQGGSLDFINNTPAHFCLIDINSTSSHNYLCQMIDGIRYYGSIAVTNPMGTYTGMFGGPGMQGGPGGGGAGGPGGPGSPGGPPGVPDMEHMRRPNLPDVMTKQQIKEYIDSTVENAVMLRKLGFEMFSFHNAYRGGPGAQFWSPICNHRTDEYGGSMKNRARLLLELFDALKQTLGRDFPLECLVSGTEEGGITVEDTIGLARLAEGRIDLLHIRHGFQDPQHPTGFTSTHDNPSPNLAVAAAVRAAVQASGTKILIGASAGFQDPAVCEGAIASGKADIICMARSWIADSEYGKKLYEGRGEDVTPCIRCNKCHVPNDSDKFRSFCSVNPLIGIEDKLDRMIAPVTGVKNVAVVGSGPAGMEAAVVAAGRGHKVTLYEKNDFLGGQIKHADYASFKWPLKDFKDYLIRQVYKAGVDVKLNTRVTRELLDNKDYDAVVVAIGPSFTRPNITGADGDNVKFAIDVYGVEEKLPEKIVVIGGSEIGVETGMYLSEKGHKVTVMTRQASLASDAAHAHYVNMLRDAYMALENFSFVTEARYTGIDATGLSYVDKEGKEQKIEAGLVVLATGAVGKYEEAMSLYGAGAVTYFIGDCERVGDVHKAVSGGFATANQI